MILQRGTALSFSFKAAVLFLAAFATTWLASTADRELGQRLSVLKRDLVVFLEQTLGRRIGYGSISPSLFQYLEIRDLAVYGDSGEPLLDVRQLRIQYDIFGLLRGQDPVSCLKDIRISNTGFSLDLDADRDLVDMLQTLMKPGGSAGGRFLGTVTGASIGVSVRSSGNSVSLTDLFFTVKGREAAVDVTLRGNVAAVLPDGLRIDTAFKAQGSVDPGFQGADVKAELIGLSTSLFEAGKQTFQITWKQKGLSLQKIQDSAPLDLRIDADPSTGDLAIAFQTDKFQPSRLVRLRGALAAYNVWLTGTYTGRGTVRYGLQSGSLGYEADLSALLMNQLPLRDVQVTGSCTGTLERVEFARLLVETPRGSVEFVGDLPFSSMYPQGRFTLRGADLFRGDRMDGVLSVARSPDGLRVESESLSFGGQSFDSVSVSVAPLAGRIRYDARLSFASSSAADLIRIRGEAALGKTVQLEGVASFVTAPVDQLIRMATGTEELPPELAGLGSLLPRLRVDAEVAYRTDLSEVRLACDSLLLSQEGAAGNAARLSLILEGRKLAVPAFAVDWNGLSVSGALTGELTRQEQISFNTDFRLRGIPYSVEGSYSPPLGLYLRGSYGLDASLIIVGRGGISFEAKADNFPIPIPGAVYTASFDLEGDFPDDGNWALNKGSVTLADLPLLESRRNLLEIGFTANPKRLAFSRIRFSDSLSVIEGGGSVAFPDGLDLSGAGLPGLSAQADLSLKAIKGTETFTLQGSYRKEKLDGTLTFLGVPLKRIGTFALAGDLAGSVRIGGSLAAPLTAIEVNLDAGRIGPDPVRLSGKAALSADSIGLEALDFSWLSHRIRIDSGKIGLDREGRVESSVRYSGEYFGDRFDITGFLSNTRIPGLSWGSLLDPILERSFSGDLVLERIQVKATDVPPWKIRFGCNGSVLSLDGGPGDKVHATLDQSGAFDILLESPDPEAIASGKETGSPLPVQGRAGGSLAGAKIDATVEVDALDLKILNTVVKTDIFQVSSGVAAGRITIKGPVGDPDYRGAMSLAGAFMRSKYTPDDIGPFRTTATFTGKAFSVPEFSTFAGKEAVRVSASFGIDRWVPVSFDLTLKAAGAPGVHMKTNFGTVQLDGFVTGTVRIAGNDKATDVKGAIQANDCQITLGKWEGGAFIPEEPPTIVALSVETGKRVEFTWPSEAWPVVRTYAAAGGRGKVDITYRGDTGAYTVTGSAEVQGGEIYYFDRSFYLRSGTIAFREDQNDFDPRIKALAEIREWDQNTGENVKIYLEADGKLSQFVPRLRSDPPHSDVEILAMIGAPILSRVTEGQNPVLTAALLGADVFGRMQILRPFEQTMREILNVDVFSIRTQVLQNVVAQKFLGLATNPLDNTSLSLGKYLGNDLYLEMMVRLQAQKGASGGGTSLWGVSPDIELNLEWTTPFFLLEWSFLPKTPENLFLTDNSISFKWRLAY